MFNDIFPMMASRQMELDETVEQIVRQIRINGTENQTFSISSKAAPFNETEIDYIEREVEKRI